jgi:hypothetical protein
MKKVKELDLQQTELTKQELLKREELIRRLIKSKNNNLKLFNLKPNA